MDRMETPGNSCRECEWLDRDFFYIDGNGSLRTSGNWTLKPHRLSSNCGIDEHKASFQVYSLN